MPTVERHTIKTERRQTLFCSSFAEIGALYNHRLFRQGLETGHVSHTFYGRRLCAVNIIMDSTFFDFGGKMSYSWFW